MRRGNSQPQFKTPTPAHYSGRGNESRKSMIPSASRGLESGGLRKAGRSASVFNFEERKERSVRYDNSSLQEDTITTLHTLSQLSSSMSLRKNPRTRVGFSLLINWPHALWVLWLRVKIPDCIKNWSCRKVHHEKSERNRLSRNAIIRTGRIGRLSIWASRTVSPQCTRRCIRG